MDVRIANDRAYVSLRDREFSSPGYELLTANKAVDQLPMIVFLVASFALIGLAFIKTGWRRIALVTAGAVALICLIILRVNIASIDTDALGGMYDVGVSIGYGWYIAILGSLIGTIGAILYPSAEGDDDQGT